MNIFSTIFGWDKPVDAADAELQRQVDEYNEMNARLAKERQERETPDELLKVGLKKDQLQHRADQLNARSRQVAEALRRLAERQLEINNEKAKLLGTDAKLQTELADITSSLTEAKREYNRLMKRRDEERRAAEKAKKDAEKKAMAEKHRKHDEELAAKNAAVSQIEADWRQGKETQ